MRLLVVEDEDAIRTALGRGLAVNGTEVATAASLAEGRTVAARFHPQALLSDLKLPDGSGLDLASELGLPFVLMSGYAAFDDAVAALRMGCVDFFTKPVPIRDLRRALDRLAVRQRMDAVQVVAPAADGTLVRVQPAAVGLIAEPFTAATLAWQTPAEAQERFAASSALTGDAAQRQVLAELLQAAPHGRLTVNRGTGWWNAWLAATVDWHDAQRERRAVVEDLAERCVWRADGVLVECADD
jgi:two-component system, LytTR family, response regulator